MAHRERPDDRDARRPSLPRRRWLRTIGAAGAVGLAGCTGQDDPDESDDDTPTPADDDGETDDERGDDGEPIDPEFTAQTWVVPSDAQYNPYNFTRYPGAPSSILFDPLVAFNSETGEFHPYLATDWSIDGDSLTITLADGRTWHDGEPVTADDLATQYRLDEYTDHPMWRYVDDFEVVDESTIELDLAGSVNEDVLKHTILTRRLNVSAAEYGEFIERLADASGGDAEDEALGELLDYAPDEPIGNGPFRFVRADSQRVLCERFDDHPAADGINFPEYAFVHISTAQNGWEALMSGEIDGNDSWYTAPEIVEGYPDHVMEIMAPIWTDFSLIFQNEMEIYRDPAVRRAFAYVLDREVVARNIGPRTREPIESVTGMSRFVLEEYVPADLLDGFDPYEVDHDRAAELLNGAGFSREDGDWYTPDGDRFRVPMKVCAGCSDFVSGTQTVASQLDAFGIEAEAVTVEATALGEQFAQGDFEVYIGQWGSWGNPYPYFDYEYTFSSETAREYYNFPAEVEVPMPVGDPDGTTETIDVRETVEELAFARGEEAAERIRELAWIFNRTVPKVQVSDRIDQAWLTTDEWNVPEPDDPVLGVKYPIYWLPRIGELTAKTD